MRVTKLAFSIAGVGIAILIILPLVIFLYDSAMNPELLRYEIMQKEDPPREVLVIMYEGRIFLSSFNIKIIMNDGSYIEKTIPILEGGSSQTIDLSLDITRPVSPVEIKVSFRIAGLYALEVDMIER